MASIIKVRVTGTSEVISYLNRVANQLNKPQDGLLRAVNNIARYWQRSFETEGALIGGWAGLAERTQEDRALQGYPPEHPIMMRYGALYRTSTVMFAAAKGNTSHTESRPYDGRALTSATLRLDDKMATLDLSGPQVFNHWPGQRTDRPARPIWFVTPPVLLEAGRGVADWIKDEVLK